MKTHAKFSDAKVTLTLQSDIDRVAQSEGWTNRDDVNSVLLYENGFYVVVTGDSFILGAGQGYVSFEKLADAEECLYVHYCHEGKILSIDDLKIFSEVLISAAPGSDAKNLALSVFLSAAEAFGYVPSENDRLIQSTGACVKMVNRVFRSLDSMTTLNTQFLRVG